MTTSIERRDAQNQWQREHLAELSAWLLFQPTELQGDDGIFRLVQPTSALIRNKTNNLYYTNEYPGTGFLVPMALVHRVRAICRRETVEQVRTGELAPKNIKKANK